MRIFLSSLVIYCLFFYTPVQLQAQDSVALETKAARSFYASVISKNTNLFSGREYEPPPMRLNEGHPYFLNPSWIKGSVTYNGKIFNDVSLKYDLVSDELVLMHFNGYFMISLNKETVDDFILEAHHFRRFGDNKKLTGNLEEGYYEVLYNGNSLLLKKHMKEINTVGQGNNQGFEVSGKTSLYLIRNGNVAAVKTKKSFMRQLPSGESLNRYVKTLKPWFKKDPQYFMVQVLKFLDKAPQ